MKTNEKWIEKDDYIDLGEFTAPGWTAKEWEAELTKNDHKLTGWAKDVLSKQDFDKNHRYEAGTKLHVVAIRGKEINKPTTSNLKALGSKRFGEKAVSELKAELTLMIRLKYSNKDLKEMNLSHIATLHEPIIDSGGGPSVLSSDRLGWSWVDAYYDSESNRWDGHGAFAFLQ